MKIRTGNGFDVHKFASDRKLILAGVDIPCTQGLLGHSDADVLTHAIMDALLGALALGDIGKWFPDNDNTYLNADSTQLLKTILASTKVQEWELSNIDCTIIAQTPKLADYINKMRSNIAKLFDCDIEQVSIKATTTEHLGFCGRKEGIAAIANLLIIQKEDNTDG